MFYNTNESKISAYNLGWKHSYITDTFTSPKIIAIKIFHDNHIPQINTTHA